MNLATSTAWVTGAGKGIGEATARALASEGVRVALTSRTGENLERVAADIVSDGGTAVVIPADVTVESDIRRAWDVVANEFGGVDILVNNAGIGRFATVGELSVSDFDAMWNLNVRGLFLCTQAVLPSMQQKQSGVIVNISSLAGKNAFVNGAGYAATKWAVNGFSNCLRLEVRKQNIKVITVCPGSVATEFTSGEKDPRRVGSILQPEDVADAIIGALKLPERAMMSEIDLRPTNPQ